MFKGLIDRWTLIHFAFWGVVGANFMWHQVPLVIAVILTFVGAVAWELIEMVLEKYNLVTGSEKWFNRWVSDIIVAGMGAGAGAWWVS